MPRPEPQQSQEYPRRSDEGRLGTSELREILIALQEEFCLSGDFLFMSGAFYVGRNQGKMWSN